MPHIRPIERHEIPQIADLHWRVFAHGLGHPPASLERYLDEMVFQQPWGRSGLSSLVYEDKSGKIVGFQGIVPRPMRMDAKPIWAAVCTQLMVDPRAHPLVGVQLLKESFSYPCDLIVADEANDRSRKLWEGIGGVTALFAGLRWTHVLRPVRFLGSLASQRGFGRRALHVVGTIVDPLLSGLMPASMSEGASELMAEELDNQTFLQCLENSYAGQQLRPDYSLASLRWLTDQLHLKRCHGTLKAVSLWNQSRTVVGCYVYYVKSGAVAQVVAVCAGDAVVGQVMDRLFDDARRDGAIAVSGRMDPRYFEVLSDKRCLFNRSYGWFLVHAKRPDIMKAIHDGRAHFSRMEGEWWMRFSEFSAPTAQRMSA